MNQRAKNPKPLKQPNYRSMNPVRLNKYLAHTYGMSRREADDVIKAGRVKINNKTAVLGNIVHLERDTVSFDNKSQLVTKERYTYLLLNKPMGYVCSRKKQGNNPTVYTLLPRQYHHLKVAGRLDKDSCGLLLLTDDGDTIFKLTHPKFGKEKVYQVGLNKPLKSGDKKKIENGVELEDGISKLQISSDTQQKTKASNQKPNSYIITMREGRNRQIRRTFKALGYTVTFLERRSIGKLSLNHLSQKDYCLIHQIIT